MTDIDIEKLAREAGIFAIYSSDARPVLMESEGPALKRFAALVLEEAARRCEAISDEYHRRESHRFPELKSDAETGASDCEHALRTIAEGLKP